MLELFAARMEAIRLCGVTTNDRGGGRLRPPAYAVGRADSTPGEKWGIHAADMSTAHHATADHHETHAFDDTPVQELSADEPRTPGWMPVLGLALFVVAAVAYLLGGDAPATDAHASVPAVTAPAPAPAPVPQPVPQAQAAAKAQAANAQADAIRRLTPEQIADLRKRIEEARKQREAEGKPVNK